jgi:hypothetical protein
VLANFITRVTSGGTTTEKTTGTFVATCSVLGSAFFVPSCVKEGGLNGLFKFDSALACNATGGLNTCKAGTVPGCCKVTGDECVFAVVPVCVLSGPATVTTVTTPSVTVAGFFTDDCNVAPGGCRACFHCCKQAYGEDADAVALCKASFCNTQRIVTRCAPARHAVRCCTVLSRDAPCLTLRHPTHLPRAARGCAR